MPVTGKAERPAAEPRKGAEPKEKTPPSAPASQYPRPPEAEVPTMGWLRATPTLTLPGTPARAEPEGGSEAVAGEPATVAAAAGEAEGRTAIAPRTGGTAMSAPSR